MPGGRWSPMPASAPIWLMAALVFFSGMAALVLQVSWFREFRLVFGSSTAASAAVMAVFMGGLGVGSAVLGRRADRTPNAVRMYAVLETGIALAAAASPWLIDLSRVAYMAMGGQSALGAAGATLVRLALCAAAIALPTFLMGGTLPAAAKAVTACDDGPRRDVARLYGLNTLGAVVGATVSTFLLLPHLSGRLTLWMACLTGMIVGAVAWVSSCGVRESAGAGILEIKRSERRPLGAAAPVPLGQDRARRRASSPGALVQTPLWFVYATACGVGFGFFVMELVWYRMLGPILGGTTYTFGLILAVALAGIGVGGAIYPFLFRRLSPNLNALAMTCGLEAVGIAVPYALGDRLAIYAAVLQQASAGFADRAAGWTLIAAITVFPAALVAGVQFPLLIALCGRGNEEVGREVGLTAAWNTAGAIFGSLAGGFGLLPLLTALGAWRVVVGLLALLSAAAILIVVRGQRPLNRGGVSAAPVAHAKRERGTRAGHAPTPGSLGHLKTKDSILGPLLCLASGVVSVLLLGATGPTAV